MHEYLLEHLRVCTYVRVCGDSVMIIHVRVVCILTRMRRCSYVERDREKATLRKKQTLDRFISLTSREYSIHVYARMHDTSIN